MRDTNKGNYLYVAGFYPSLRVFHKVILVHESVACSHLYNYKEVFSVIILKL